MPTVENVTVNVSTREFGTSNNPGLSLTWDSNNRCIPTFPQDTTNKWQPAQAEVTGDIPTTRLVADLWQIPGVVASNGRAAVTVTTADHNGQPQILLHFEKNTNMADATEQALRAICRFIASRIGPEWEAWVESATTTYQVLVTQTE